MIGENSMLVVTVWFYDKYYFLTAAAGCVSLSVCLDNQVSLRFKRPHLKQPFQTCFQCLTVKTTLC